MPEIDIASVSFDYGPHPVLRDIDLVVGRGDFVCLLGPSGCGKSTLLRLLAGLAKPGSGTITIGGAPLAGPGLDRGVVFQDYSLFPWMSAGENVELVLAQAFPDKRRRERRELAQSYLEMVGLPEVFDKLPSQLSGGMRQRAAIARAFAGNAPTLLMDEPFGALDAITRARLQDLLLELWQQGSAERKTVVFVTHDVDEAILLADRVVVMGLNPGRVDAVIPVDVPRPRHRKDLLLDKRFAILREKVVETLNRNLQSRLDEAQTVGDSGEGI